jgi:hypothetical protein
MISRFQLTDPTITSHSICSTSNSPRSESLLTLCCGSEISISSSNKSEFLSNSRELENSELYLIVDEHISGESITMENTISHCISWKLNSINCEREPELISSTLFKIENSELDELDLFDFDNILRRKLLRIKSKDSVSDIIDGRGSETFFELFRLFGFEFLSLDPIPEFSEKSQDMNDSLSLLSWCQLYCQLIDLKSSFSLSEVISHLTSKIVGIFQTRIS